MRFISYQGPLGPTWGGLTDKGVVEARALDAALPASLLGFIQCCATDPNLVARTAGVFALACAPGQSLEGLDLLPCVPALQYFTAGPRGGLARAAGV